MGSQIPAPHTPKKGRLEEELRDAFFKVSENYKLGLILTDKPQSPSRLKQVVLKVIVYITAAFDLSIFPVTYLGLWTPLGTRLS